MIESDPQWYKDAVIYELHVKAFFDSNGDGMGDFPGLIQKLDYLQGLGITCLWILPFYPSPLARRRVRHLELHQGQQAVRGPQGLQKVRPRSARAGHPGHHRAGHQPHVGPAPVVSAGAERADWVAGARLLRLDRRPDQVQRRPDHLHRLGAVELDVGPRRQAVLLAPVLLPPARPQLREPPGPQGRLQGHAVLARPRGRRDAARRHPVPDRARGDELREPARKPRDPQAVPQGDGYPLPGPDVPGRGEPVARRRLAVLRRRRRVPDDVPLSAHAADVHGAPAGRPAPDRRDHAADPRHPRRLPVGALSSGTTTS